MANSLRLEYVSMVDSTRGIGSSVLGSALRDVFGLDRRAATGAGGDGTVTAIAATTPTGPRGRRMLAAGTDVESLDRNVARGTYLDILV